MVPGGTEWDPFWGNSFADETNDDLNVSEQKVPEVDLQETEEEMEVTRTLRVRCLLLNANIILQKKHHVCIFQNVGQAIIRNDRLVFSTVVAFEETLKNEKKKTNDEVKIKVKESKIPLSSSECKRNSRNLIQRRRKNFWKIHGNYNQANSAAAEQAENFSDDIFFG